MFSVILPVHNRSAVLGRAITSVLCQDWSDFELIIVDDGSRDDSVAIARSFKDPRISVVELANNLGPAGARNVGIERASGEYLAFLDSDDEWMPIHLARAADAYARNPRIDVTYARMRFHRQRRHRGFPAKALGPSAEEVFVSLIGGNSIGLPTVTAKKSAVVEVGGFDSRLRTLEDWDLLLRLARSGCSFEFLDETVLEVTESEYGVNRLSGHTIDAAILVAEKFGQSPNQPTLSKRLSGQLLYLEGAARIALGDVAGGRTALSRALSVDRSRLKYLLAYAISWLAPSDFVKAHSTFVRVRRDL